MNLTWFVFSSDWLEQPGRHDFIIKGGNCCLEDKMIGILSEPTGYFK